MVYPDHISADGWVECMAGGEYFRTAEANATSRLEVDFELDAPALFNVDLLGEWIVPSNLFLQGPGLYIDTTTSLEDIPMGPGTYHFVVEAQAGFAANDLEGHSFGSFHVDIEPLEAPVPEPGSVTLLGLGLATLAVRRFRKRR